MRNFMNSVALPKVGTNVFDRGHDVKYSFSMGELIPLLCEEILPGDKFSISVTNMLRFAPLLAPVMHRVRARVDFFFVPNRLLWEEWPDWISGNSDVEAPYCLLNDQDYPGSLGDYLGYVAPPTGTAADLKVSPMAAAAYYLIFDEYYRDQNLVAEKFVPLTPGNNATYVSKILNDPLVCAWERDYFTAALPFAQKGDAVQIPLTFQQNIPVDFAANGAAGTARAAIGGALIGDNGPIETQGGAGVLVVDGVGATAMAYDPNGTLVVDVQSDATDINTLRQALALQRFLEIDARGGTRYTETLQAHFNVRSSDARLQRPEFLGRVRQNMVISEVLSTAQTNTTEGDPEIPVGYLGGHGISVGSGNRINFRAEEHGYLFGIISVRPDTAYQQGIERGFTRFAREDYYWPSFAHLGEQEVKLKELWVGAVADADTWEETFGYMPRYGEYRFKNSRVAGEMKSSLSFWHLGRIFDLDEAQKPVLNQSFIDCYPSDRIFAVQSDAFDTIYAHSIFDIKAVRKIPKFGIPSI